MEVTANLFFIDCEAPYGCMSPASGDMTEFGAAHWLSSELFHGRDCSKRTFEVFRDWIIEVGGEGRPMMISDNPAYDWQWINYYFDKHLGENPLGFSARRIGDFYAGLMRDFKKANNWKRLRVTKHDHNPVHDAQGNLEAFRRILQGER